jgi:WD40 repeat protein
MRFLTGIVPSILLTIILSFHFTEASAQTTDSIQDATISSNGQFFITVSGKGISRIQYATGRKLTAYEPVTNLQKVFTDEPNNKLIGISSSELTVWDIFTGKITSHIPYPSGFNLRENISRSKRDRFPADFDPQSGCVAIVSGFSFIVIDISKQATVYSGSFENLVENPVLIKNGRSLLLSDFIQKQAFAFDLDTKKRTIIVSDVFVTRIVPSADHKKFFVGDYNKLSVYNDNLVHQYDFTSQTGGMGVNGAFFLDNFDAVAMPTGNSYIEIYFKGSQVPVTINTGMNMDGVFGSNRNFIIWQHAAVSIIDYTGQKNYFQSDIHQPLASTGSKNLNYSFADSLLIYSAGGKEIQLVHNDPVTVCSNDKLLLSADVKGQLYEWSAAGKLIAKHDVLSGAITHLKPISTDNVLVGAFGRAVEYNLKTKTFGKILRGHKGNVISSFVDPIAGIIVTGTSENQLMVWDLSKGALIKAFVTGDIPVSIAVNAGKLSYADHSGKIFSILAGNELDAYFKPSRKIIINTSHRGNIQSLSFSKDGKQLLSGDAEGVIKVWDVASLVPLRSLFMDNAAGHAIFSQDGKEILNFGQNHIFHINALTGNLIKSYEMPSYYSDVKVHELSLHPNNRTVYINNNESSQQLLLNLNDQKFYYRTNTEHRYGPFGQDISPDGSLLATLGNDIEIFDILNGKKLKTIIHPNQHYKNKYAVRVIRFSPDGKLLLAEGDKSFSVYNVETGARVAITKHALNAAFTGPRELVYYDNSNGNELTGIDLSTGAEQFRRNISKDAYVIELSYDPVNNLLAAGLYNGEVWLLNADNGNLIKNNRVHASRTYGSLNQVTGDMALAIPNKVKIFDWLHTREKKELTVSNNGSTPKPGYSPDGELMVVSLNYSTKIFNRGGDEILDSINHAGNAFFSTDSKWMAIVDFDTVFVYDAARRAFDRPVMQFKNNFLGQDFIPGKNQIRYIRSEQKKEQEKLLYYESKADFFIGTYDIETGKLVKEELLKNYSYVSDLKYSPDGNYYIFSHGWGNVAVNTAGGKTTGIEHNGPVDYLDITPSGKEVIIGDDEGGLFLYDIVTGKFKNQLKGHTGSIRNISFWKDNMLSTSGDGSGIVWDLTGYSKKVQVNPFDNGEYVFISPDNYYTGTTGIAQAVFFNEKDRVFPFEQYDLIYNRPDLVVKAIDSTNSQLITAYYDAYKKRLNKAGFDLSQMAATAADAPEITIHRTDNSIETPNRTLSFRMNATDKSAPLENFNVWVNDVPFYGAKGFNLKDKKSKQFSKDITIDLSDGRNKIQVACYNNKGVESLKETFEITYNPPVKQKPDLYIIALSVSDYQNNTYDLKYARKDGRDMVNTFLERSGGYRNVYIDTLFDKDAVREKFLGLRTKLEKTTVNDHVIVFISGHGVLDKNYNFYYATSDLDFQNPAKRGLAYEEIESVLDGIPARQKLLFMDACHSGEVDRGSLEKKNVPLTANVKSTFRVNKRGGELESDQSGLSLSNSFLLMQELFANLHRGSGTVVISAAAGDSYAFESDTWQNGIFTYSLIDGLNSMKADANRDGVVTVNELRDHIYKSVEAATAGNQKPTARQQNLELDFKVW